MCVATGVKNIRVDGRAPYMYSSITLIKICLLSYSCNVLGALKQHQLWYGTYSYEPL